MHTHIHTYGIWADASHHVHGGGVCVSVGVGGRGIAQELAEMLDKLVAADKLEIVDSKYTIKQ